MCILSKNMKNIRICYLKFSINLNRRVFVMGLKVQVTQIMQKPVG